ncbi:hypothetical protein ONZ45_g17546 [Pleurotus djamor]|nr:hypothetical protein ONZ45_g17546 [Pleurotus djamor]
MGVVPIVNENDTVSVSEIKFGDNDTLSAITSSMIHADYLFLLTDVDGLYTSNPRKDPDARQIEVVDSILDIRNTVSTTTLGSSLGTGGMETKIIAAEIATAAGVTTIITSSKKPENVLKIIEYHNAVRAIDSPNLLEAASNTNQGLSGTSTPVRPIHTVFTPSTSPMRDLKAWTRHTLNPAGSVVIDSGAHHVLSRKESGGRLLAAGVVEVIGAFASGQAVKIVIRKPVEGATQETPDKSAYSRALQATRPSTPTHTDSSEAPPLSSVEDDLILVPKTESENNAGDVVEVGRGLANYNSEQISRVKGLNSSYLPKMLGYADSEYVVENITIRIPP